MTLETSLRLAARIPPSVVKVSESGIHSRADVTRLASGRLRRFLVGEHLMKAADPAAALREHCRHDGQGLRNHAARRRGSGGRGRRVGAGFIFYPRSPRYVTPERAAELGDGPCRLESRRLRGRMRRRRSKRSMRAANLDVAQIYGGAAPGGRACLESVPDRPSGAFDPRWPMARKRFCSTVPPTVSRFDWTHRPRTSARKSSSPAGSTPRTSPKPSARSEPVGRRRQFAPRIVARNQGSRKSAAVRQSCAKEAA